MLAVEVGAHPVDRASWVWAPELSWVMVRAPWALDDRARRLVAGLGLAALGSVAVVVVYARRAGR